MDDPLHLSNKPPPPALLQFFTPPMLHPSGTTSYT